MHRSFLSMPGDLASALTQARLLSLLGNSEKSRNLTFILGLTTVNISPQHASLCGACEEELQLLPPRGLSPGSCCPEFLCSGHVVLCQVNSNLGASVLRSSFLIFFMSTITFLPPYAPPDGQTSSSPLCKTALTSCLCLCLCHRHTCVPDPPTPVSCSPRPALNTSQGFARLPRQGIISLNWS